MITKYRINLIVTFGLIVAVEATVPARGFEIGLDPFCHRPRLDRQYG
jgi:hypothetical protein